MRNKSIVRLIRASVGACAVCVAGYLPRAGVAQVISDPPASSLDEVVVTGSHLARSVADQTGPTIVVTSADIERTASDAIGKILQALPMQTGTTLNTNNNFGDGSARINLRGLGEERTLVLLNGRRFIFGGLGADSSVDLNTIPVSMVDHVEIFGSGASAIYGSDAVAGVVNIITRTKFSGLETGADYRVAERGDGAVRTVHALAGLDGSRGNLVAGIEYVNQSAVSQGARAYSAHVESLVSPTGPVVRSGSFSTPQGVFIAPDNMLGWGDTLLTRATGSGGVGAADFRPFNPATDFFNYAPYSYLQLPSERSAVWLSGHGRLTDSIEIFTESLAQRQRSRQQVAPSDYSNFRAGGAPVDPTTGAQVIPADNYYNPFGVNAIAVFRVLLEGGPLSHAETGESYRQLVGLRGTAGSWHWESGVTWARNTATETDTGELLRDALRSAVGPSGLDASGTVVCGTPNPLTHTVATGDVIAGCVPLNLFGGLGADGRGTITPAQLAYISHTLRNSGNNEHWVVDANVSGPLGHLPAGNVDAVFGAQYRHESGALALDPLTGRGVASGFALQLPTEVSFAAREIYAEMRVPLQKNADGERELEVNPGFRYSRFSPFGDNTSAQLGVRWKIAPVITMRGSYAQVFRAPNTFESFATPQSEVQAIADPCGTGPTPAQQAHCAANGVPGGAYNMPDTHGTGITFGGYPRLTPESGETWTAGLLFPYDRFQGSVAVDYWHIRLNHAVDAPGPQEIADECADTGSAQACGRITRSADGSISQIDARYANLTRLTVDGVDISLSGSHTFWSGELIGHANGTYLRSVAIKRFDEGATAELAGTFQDDTSWPRWRAQAALDWLRGPWRASYSIQLIGAQHECGDKIFPGEFAYFSPDQCRIVDRRVYHDISASRSLAAGLRISVSIENLLATNPPRINTSDTANTDPAIYRLLGRTYAVRAVYTHR